MPSPATTQATAGTSRNRKRSSHRVDQRKRNIADGGKRILDLVAVRRSEPHEVERRPAEEHDPVDPPWAFDRTAALRGVHTQHAEFLHVHVPDVPRSSHENDRRHDDARSRVPQSRARQEPDQHEEREPREPFGVRVEDLTVEIDIRERIVTMGEREPHDDEKHQDLMLAAREIRQGKKDEEPAERVSRHVDGQAHMPPRGRHESKDSSVPIVGQRAVLRLLQKRAVNSVSRPATRVGHGRDHELVPFHGIDERVSELAEETFSDARPQLEVADGGQKLALSGSRGSGQPSPEESFRLLVHFLCRNRCRLAGSKSLEPSLGFLRPKLVSLLRAQRFKAREKLLCQCSTVFDSKAECGFPCPSPCYRDSVSCCTRG